MAAIYKSFEYKGLDIPYFRAISLVVLALYMNIMSCVSLFNISLNGLMFIAKTDNRNIQSFKTIAFMAVIYITIFIFFSKKKLDNVLVDGNQVANARVGFGVYFILSFILLTTTLVIRGVKEGKISF